MNQRYLKKFRLQKKKDFLQVLSYKKNIKGKYIYIDFFYSNGKIPKLGISPSVKYGNACERNLFKRHLREIFRKNLSLIPQNLVMNIKPITQQKKASYEDLVKDFLSLMQKCNSQ